MGDYIKREDAIKTVYKLREYFKCWDRNDDIAIKNALNAIPAANVVEVVRCKDCRHWKNTHLCEAWSRHGTIETKAEQFCSYGERKDEGL